MRQATGQGAVQATERQTKISSLFLKWVLQDSRLYGFLANPASEAKQGLSSINVSIIQLKGWNNNQGKGATENLEGHKHTRYRQMLLLILKIQMEG